MQPPVPVIVFDFDGTLVRGDSVATFSLAFLVKRPLRLICLLPALPFVLPLLASERWLSPGVTAFWWLLSWGTRTRTLAEELLAYSRTVLVRRTNGATLAELKAHLARGDRVVVATAAPPLVARELLRKNGVPAVPVVGTRLVRRYGGLVARPHCFGERKVEELERRHHVRKWAEVYSDSDFDLPIMRLAERVTLVAPSSRARARIERELSPRVSVRLLPELS